MTLISFVCNGINFKTFFVRLPVSTYMLLYYCWLIHGIVSSTRINLCSPQLNIASEDIYVLHLPHTSLQCLDWLAPGTPFPTFPSLAELPIAVFTIVLLRRLR